MGFFKDHPYDDRFTIDDPARDKKAGFRIEQFRFGELAVYFPPMQYLPYAACTGVEIVPASFHVTGGCGKMEQSGLPVGFGGPYLGFMATTTKYMRKLPGRIVGETVDSKGERAYVLSLQAREQHIRREKASSNICSNEALCALTAAVYLATMGPDGLAEAARQSMAKAHYLCKQLTALDGVELVYRGEFFHEFVTTLPKQGEVLRALEAAGILGGLPIAGGVLWCATEKAGKAELDRAAAIVKEVLAK